MLVADRYISREWGGGHTKREGASVEERLARIFKVCMGGREAERGRERERLLGIFKVHKIDFLLEKSSHSLALLFAEEAEMGELL